MYCRISWGRVDPGKWDEFEDDWRSTVEKLGPQPGLRMRALMRDRDDPDALYSVSWWDSMEELTAYEEGPNREFIQAVEANFAAAFVINRLNVVLHEQYDPVAAS
jgi:heme-degrading monooxygenase HmoA